MPRAPHPVTAQLQEAFEKAKADGTLGEAMLAYQATTTPREIKDWFTGRRTPTFRQVDIFARLLGLELTLRDHDSAAMHALKELTQAITEENYDPESDRVHAALRAARKLMRSEGDS